MVRVHEPVHRNIFPIPASQARLRDRVATSDLRLSALLELRTQPVAVQCLLTLTPAAWFMEERVPDLTQRMRNELSESPETVQRIDRAKGMSSLRLGRLSLRKRIVIGFY
jgi:hypothetical protein